MRWVGEKSVDVIQGRGVFPLGGGFDLAVAFAYEDLSGASPWQIKPRDANVVGGLDLTPTVVMSGATIEETRTDVSATLNYSSGNYGWSATTGVSVENDYESLFFGGSVAVAMNRKHTTLSTGFLYADDTIEPSNLEDDVAYQAPSVATCGFALGRIPEADKTALSTYVSLNQVIDRYSTFEMALGYKYNDGFLSDPYKQAYILFAPNGCALSDRLTVADSRPDERTIYTVSARYRQFIPLTNSALHLNYRYYDDDWEIESHTMEVVWYQNFIRGWQLVPSIRWYSQTEAGFYEPYYETARLDRLASGDYRLSGYGALTYKLGLNKVLGNWRFKALYEYYDSGESFGHDASAIENPALVDFSRMSVGFDYSF